MSRQRSPSSRVVSQASRAAAGARAAAGDAPPDRRGVLADMPAGRRNVLLALLGLPLVFGIGEAVQSAWVCDDVFISFRYIDQWLRGNGLVFNPGERVEGYTHFLWVVILAALRRLGLDLVTLGRYLPIAAFAAMLVILLVRAVRRPRPVWLVLPIAAWGLALHKDAQVFASSGLETSAFALLLLLGLLEVTRDRARVGLAAAVYAVATLVRPEGALFTATAAGYVLWRWRGRRQLLEYAGVWVALVAPFVIWRLAYYGSLLPNTYYAKSAGLSYWSQGWQYTSVYFSIYSVLLLCGVLALGFGIATRGRREVAVAGEPVGLPLLAAVQVLLTVLYVTRTGGDFMFARFYIPVTPLVYLLLEETLRRVERPALVVACAVAVVGLTLYARRPRDSTFVGTVHVHSMVNEANCYPADAIAKKRHEGEVLESYLQGTEAKVALQGGQDCIGYFGHLPYAVEWYGLTDPELAHQPVAKRSRPGHEKTANLAFLQRRGVHFQLLYGWTVGLKMEDQIKFQEVVARIVTYDRALMDRLKERPGVSFIDFPTFLDSYVQQLRAPAADGSQGDAQAGAPLDAAQQVGARAVPQRTAAQPLDAQQSRRLLEDYVRFQRFYFQHNQDPERLASLRAALQAAGITEEYLQAADRAAVLTH